MTLKVDINSGSHEAVLIKNDVDSDLWATLGGLIRASVPTYQQSSDIGIIPWHIFLRFMGDITRFTKTHGIRIEVSQYARQELTKAKHASYREAIQATPIPEESIQPRLDAIGFSRQLTENQLHNVSILAPLTGGATFSVPGAGKTTEALAYFFLNAKETDRLLVVAPISAFLAWDEQLSDCMPSEERHFVRLRGGASGVEALLKDNPRYMIISYQLYARVKDLIHDMLTKADVFMYLDESHKIKSGRSIVSGDAILSSSYLPKRKLIMSGTPMPQSVNDLIPQLSFLYPDARTSPETVVEMFQPIFVRTTSGQLGIPSVTRKTVTLDMDPLQREVYKTLKSEMRRQLIPYFSDASRYNLRKVGSCVMKVVQFVSNPSLLARDLEYSFNKQIGELLLRNCGPKITYVCNRARELAAQGKKVLIWSSFVSNVELIATRLRDIGADFIHGSVDAGSEDDVDTREWKIKEFHSNPEKMVLVANPAAASEGISLHRICQYAIYVDRLFNAAQYLQSEDRIHRLGLRHDQHPVVEIVECADTIDQVIARRLTAKVARMSEALNDPSLSIVSIDDGDEQDVDIDVGLTEDDLQCIRDFFMGGDVE